MSNFYYDLDIESVLQCPVCYELPQNIIFLCKVGHHMCEKCRKRLTTCPTCQSAITGARNFLAECLIAKFSVLKVDDLTPNNNDQSNVSLGTPVHRVQQNDTELKPLPLPEGAYKCELEACRNRQETMGVGDLFPHIQSKHSHLFEKFQNKSATFTKNFDSFCFMKSKHNYHRAFHVSNMGLVFFNIKVTSDRFINCWLSIPAPVRRSNQFDYEIEFSKEDDNMKFTFVSKLASNLQSCQWLLERGRVFVIPPTSHNLQNGHFFSLLVKIVYHAPVRSDPTNEYLTNFSTIE